MVNPIRIQICKKPGCSDVPLPRYMSDHAAGMDLCAACEGEVRIAPGEIRLIQCGFYMAVPVGYEAQVRPRSGLALRHGISLPNAPGTIDSCEIALPVIAPLAKSWPATVASSIMSSWTTFPIL